MALPGSLLKVALCQMTSSDDVKANQKQMLDLLEQVASGTQLVCFPENSLFFRIRSSAPLTALALTDPFFDQLQQHVELQNRHLLLTLPLQKETGVTNATVMIAPGQSPQLLYEKIHLFDVDVAGHPPVRESDQFQFGRLPGTTNIAGWDIGLSICYDLRFPELYLTYARRGLPVMLVPSAFLVPTGQAHWHVLLRARAIEAQSYILAPAQGGRHVSGDQERFTFGHTLAVDPWGKIIGEINNEGSGLLQIELDPAQVQKVRRQIPMANHRRLE